jgi:hypothetical protein
MQGRDDARSLDPSVRTVDHGANPDRPTKRQRLSLACNECRKRKVKCDSEMPRCRNCRIRGQVCETSDPKHPELVVVRKYGAMEGDFREDSYGMASDFSPAPVAHQEPNTPVSLPREQSTSWVARSYQAHRSLDEASVNRAEESPAPPGNAASHQQRLHESHQSPEMTVNTDSNNDRQKVMGGSSLQSLSMFLDLYLRRSMLTGIGSCFHHGMSFAEEYVLPLSLSLPDLPPSSLMERYVHAYTRSIHPLYPVLELEQLYSEVHRIRSYQDASWSPSGGFSGLK